MWAAHPARHPLRALLLLRVGQQASIAEKAKQAVADGADEKKSEQLLRGEFEKLLQLLRPETSVEKADLQQLKDKVFGPQTFFVTETRLTEEYLKDAGWLVRRLALSLVTRVPCGTRPRPLTCACCACLLCEACICACMDIAMLVWLTPHETHPHMTAVEGWCWYDVIGCVVGCDMPCCQEVQLVQCA